MEKFLLSNYALLNNGIAFVPAMVGILYFRKFKNSEVRYFIYFLAYVALFQLFGTYPAIIELEWLQPLKNLIVGTVFEKNYWCFTLFWSIGSAVFYSFYFQGILKNGLYKNVIKLLTILFMVSSVVYILLRPEEFFNKAIPFIKVFGAVVILLCTIFYFIETLRSERVLTFYKSINFFISAIIFIWWLVTTPVVFFDIYFSASDWSFVFLRWQIFLFMNLFMYLAFAFAFIWCKSENEESLTFLNN